MATLSYGKRLGERDWCGHNLVPRACDPREGNEGSGIIRFREDSDWPLKWMRSSILATIPGFRQRIIPEPSFPSQGSQARGTRLVWPEPLNDGSGYEIGAMPVHGLGWHWLWGN